MGQNALEEHFLNPPTSAKARTWWHWSNGNVTQTGITADVGYTHRKQENGTTAIPLHFEKEQSLFVIFRKPVPSGTGLTYIEIENKKDSETIPEGLEIKKAEYVSFLPAGLIDVTQEIADRIQEGKVDIHAGFADAAPGYIKELRLAYLLDGEYREEYLAEHEHISLKASSPDGLKILRAIYGKFDKGLRGIPPQYQTEDVTTHIRRLLQEGTVTLPVSKSLATKEHPEGLQR